jgi:hypothetical protein
MPLPVNKRGRNLPRSVTTTTDLGINSKAFAGAARRQSSFPQWPSSAATARRRTTNSRHFEIEAFRHFQHRQFGDIPVRLVAENFRQEKNVIENLAGHALFTRSHLCDPLSVQQKGAASDYR